MSSTPQQSADPQRIEQAVFTSVRGTSNEGYQIAAASSGVSDGLRRELTQWGPAHDSLQPDRRSAVGFAKLRNGLYMLSKTVMAGQEYSLRGGPRLYTQFFLLPPDVLQRFSYQPFRVLEALVASGHCQILDPLPESLESFRLVGRASAAQASMLASVTRELGANRIAAALTAALTTRPLAIATPGPLERLYAVLMDLLPVSLRGQTSFTAGLRFTPRRPFRWFGLGDDPRERRRLQRVGDLLLIDLGTDLPTRLTPTQGWARLVAALLQEQRFTEIREVLRATKNAPLPECDRMADDIWRRWKEAGHLQELISQRGTLPSSTRETCQTGNDCHGVRLTPLDGTAR